MHMDTTMVRSPLSGENLEECLSGMAMNFMVYACQEVRFKRLAGITGLGTCSRGEAWTCRLDSRSGVYGIMPCGTLVEADMVLARFSLFYFPDPDEEILEHSLLMAAMTCQATGYWDKVRDFTAHPEEMSWFPAGELVVGMDRDEKGLVLGLEARDVRLTISRDGVTYPDGQGYLVDPGDPEERFPENEVATFLFEALAAAVSFTVKRAPEASLSGSRTVNGRIHDRSGGITEAADHPANLIHRSVVWGEMDGLMTFSGLQDLAPDPEIPGKELFWQTHDLPALERSGEHDKIFDMRPQFIILSGFLGSGKTTFLNQLIEYYTSRNESVAVIQNEIGATGLDGKILEHGVEAVEMDEGCVCCTLSGKLGRGIQEIIATYRPMTIVLECTGLANPMNVITELDGLRDLVRLDSVTTLIDGIHGLDMFDSHEIAREQAKAADVIVVNKSDLIDAQKRTRVMERVAALNPRAAVLHASYGRVAFGTLYNDSPQVFEPGLLPGVPASHHDHRDEGFSTVKVDLPEAVEEDALTAWLDRCPAEIFRIKGLVRVRGREVPMVVQYVGGRWEMSRFAGELLSEPFLVAIGRHMDSGDIGGYLAPYRTLSTQGDVAT
ncbi:CobW family GTP-binding protein [Desulfoplanes sp.]